MRAVASSNPKFDKCVVINSFAVTGTSCEMLRIYAQDTEDNQVVASSLKGFNIDNTKEIWVPAISLSEIIGRMPEERIDLLKMDCEGGEYDIVFNSPPGLFRQIERMLIEVHDVDSQSNVGTFSQYLEHLGYHVSYVPINGFCYALEAYRR
ncbi:FkbM family methyltransferase [Dyadobacter sp. CY261]|nr:FkbM family methyltransferase [Dyadobacter sp. CY261]